MRRNIRTVSELGTRHSSIRQFLKPDMQDVQVGDAIYPRNITNCHYVFAQPEPVSEPYLIDVSQSCAASLGLSLSQNDDILISILSGNAQSSVLGMPYCTVYGCHSFGTWFGQLGDGRAMSLGEVYADAEVSNDLNKPNGKDYGLHVQELQLKGCGRSPFSRGFDGRAVLRSSVREYLVSEAMHHLKVPTTRALSIVGTGDTVSRAWYTDSSVSRQNNTDQISETSSGRKYAPRVLIREKGAIVCRVSRSFLRFGHLELLAKRNELDLLIQMADYVCFREFPHLQRSQDAVEDTSVASGNLPELPTALPLGSPQMYVKLFAAVVERSALLMADWLRVGYVHGNMNSDNCCLGGRTLDFGPFGWMEHFEPLYQPFTSDTSGNFAFARQPEAMALNLQVLADTAFIPLVRHSAASKYGPEADDCVEELCRLASHGFWTSFSRAYDEVKRRKLGFAIASEEVGELWSDMEKLMERSRADFTMFFRELAHAADCGSASEALDRVQTSFDSSSGAMASGQELRSEWQRWMQAYLARIKSDNQDPVLRRSTQNAANPKYVLRNWMSTLAYERADQGDFMVVRELRALLEQPYAEQTSESAEKWYRKTPGWACNMPGVAFMSCSS